MLSTSRSNIGFPIVKMYVFVDFPWLYFPVILQVPKCHCYEQKNILYILMINAVVFLCSDGSGDLKREAPRLRNIPAPNVFLLV